MPSSQFLAAFLGEAGAAGVADCHPRFAPWLDRPSCSPLHCSCLRFFSSATTALTMPCRVWSQVPRLRLFCLPWPARRSPLRLCAQDPVWWVACLRRACSSDQPSARCGFCVRSVSHARVTAAFLTLLDSQAPHVQRHRRHFCLR